MPSSYPTLNPSHAIVASSGAPTTGFLNSINNAFREIGQQLGLIKAAQATATGAANVAAAAESAANQATAKAAEITAAQAVIAAQLTAFAADGILSPMEKRPFMALYSRITSEQTDMVDKANLYGIVAERDAYTAAITALNSYLATQTNPFSWNNTAGNTTIDGPTFEAKFNQVAIRQTLLANAIAAKAKALAESASTGGNGNRVRFSMMEAGTQGYAALFNPHNLSGSINAVTDSGSRYAVLYRPWTGINQVFSIGTPYDAAFRIPVRPGERIFAGARIGIDANGIGGGRDFGFVIGWLNQDGAGLGSEFIHNGPVTATNNYGKFFTVPAGAYGAWFEVYTYNNQSGAAFATIFFGEPMLCGAGPLQTVWPKFSPGPGTEFGADVTSWISGVDATFQHDSQGNLQPGQARTLTYTLDGTNGTITSGVTWKLKIKIGQMNTLYASETEYDLNSTGGIGHVEVSSLQTTSVVELIAIRNGMRKTRPIILSREQTAPSVTPPTSGGGGGGAPSPAGASKNEGWNELASTSYVELGRLNMVASTGVNLTASLTFDPDYLGPTNSCTISLKWQREVTIDSGAWEDASPVSSGQTRIYVRTRPKTYIYENYEPDDPDSERVVTPCTIQCNGAVSGVSGVQRFRLVAAGSNVVSQFPLGTASANPQ